MYLLVGSGKKFPLVVTLDIQVMLIIIFLSLFILVGQAIPWVFSIASVISNCESNNQNCLEGKFTLKNPFQTEIPIFSLISSQDISLDINFYIINHYFQIDLVITPAFIWKDRFHGTAQRWWILVEVNRFLRMIKHYNCLFFVFVICLHTHTHTHTRES